MNHAALLAPAPVRAELKAPPIHNAPAFSNTGAGPVGLRKHGRMLGSASPEARRVAGVPIATGAWRDWDGMLVLDARGCITFCNTPAADLFGRAKDDVIGKQVTTLIPELPFGRYTPEFNLAFVFFHGDDGLWTRRSLRTSDGGQLAIDVSIGSATGGPLSSVSEIDKRSIVLVIKDASVPAGMARRAYIPVNRAIQARDTVGTEIRSN